VVRGQCLHVVRGLRTHLACTPERLSVPDGRPSSPTGTRPEHLQWQT
jgi:hypothetical protein